MPSLGPPEQLFLDADHAVVFANPVVVQVRRGPMTLASLEKIDRAMRDARARHLAPGARTAAIAVLEEGAPVMGDDVRARQRKAVEGQLEGVDARLAVMVVGDGVGAMMQRTVARGVLFANARVKAVKTAAEAAAWVAPHVGAPAAEVAALIDRVRGLKP
jgi:hypothetical protein